jgi:hypothetical protein
MSPAQPEPRVLVGTHCTIVITQPVPSAVIVQISGMDVGELAERPFQALDALLRPGTPVELFIDARDARGPSVDVSAHWAAWLREHRQSFRHVNMLTRSRFVQLTADFVQRFAELGDRMRIFTDPTAFDAVLQIALQT